MSILKEGKINIFFENLLTLNPLFTKFLRRLTTRHCFRFSTSSQSKNVAKKSNIKTNQHEKCVYIANTPTAKVWLNGKFCKTLINTEAEINIMIEKIHEKLDLFD